MLKIAMSVVTAMGIRVNIDLDVDSIFDEEFQTGLNETVRDVVEEALDKHIRAAVVQLIQHNTAELDTATEEYYKKRHAEIMQGFKQP